MDVALAAAGFFINLGTVKNTGGPSVPGSQVHDELKSSAAANWHAKVRVSGPVILMGRNQRQRYK